MRGFVGRGRLGPYAGGTSAVAFTDRLAPTAPPTAAAPTGAPAATATDEPDDEEQQAGADRGVDDRGHDPGTNMETELRHQPVADEGADNPDYQVANDA